MAIPLGINAAGVWLRGRIVERPEGLRETHQIDFFHYSEVTDSVHPSYGSQNVMSRSEPHLAYLHTESNIYDFDILLVAMMGISISPGALSSNISQSLASMGYSSALSLIDMPSLQTTPEIIWENSQIIKSWVYPLYAESGNTQPPPKVHFVIPNFLNIKGYITDYSATYGTPVSLLGRPLTIKIKLTVSVVHDMPYDAAKIREASSGLKRLT